MRAASSRCLATPLAGLLIACLFAFPAQAAEGLYLTWNDCWQGQAASNQSFACNTNAGQSDLYCAFTMPEAASNVVAVEIVIDVQHSGAQLPDWWMLRPGDCRGDITQFSLAAAADPGGRTACVNMWQGAGTPAAANEPVYTPSEPRNQASQARIKVTANVSSQDAVDLDGTSMYYAARLIIRHNKTVGTPSCAGCNEAACLVMNSILVGRVSGNHYYLQTPGPGSANWALWQGGAGADCAAVPVRNRAWGQLKGLYR